MRTALLTLAAATLLQSSFAVVVRVYIGVPNCLGNPTHIYTNVREAGETDLDVLSVCDHGFKWTCESNARDSDFTQFQFASGDTCEGDNVEVQNLDSVGNVGPMISGDTCVPYQGNGYSVDCHHELGTPISSSVDVAFGSTDEPCVGAYTSVPGDTCHALDVESSVQVKCEGAFTGALWEVTTWPSNDCTGFAEVVQGISSDCHQNLRVDCSGSGDGGDGSGCPEDDRIPSVQFYAYEGLAWSTSHPCQSDSSMDCSAIRSRSIDGEVYYSHGSYDSLNMGTVSSDCDVSPRSG